MAEKSIQEDMLPLVQLKPLLGLAEKEVLSCAIGLTPGKKDVVFLVDKKLPPLKVAEKLRGANSGLDAATVRFGTVTIAPEDPGTVKVQLNKAAPGGTIPLFVKLIKRAGYQAGLLDVGGPEADPASAIPEPPPVPPPSGPAPTVRLNALALRIGPVIAVDPSQREKLVGLVREAQLALAAGKPIEALLDQLAAALGASAGSAPGSLAETPTDGPKVALAKSSQLWRGCRSQMRSKLDRLKAAIAEAYADQPQVLKAIRQNFGELDRIFEKLDDRLDDTLDKALSAADANDRSILVEQTREIIADYTAVMDSDPLLEQLDGNPFGVEMKFKETLGKVLPALTGLTRTLH